MRVSIGAVEKLGLRAAFAAKVEAEFGAAINVAEVDRIGEETPRLNIVESKVLHDPRCWRARAHRSRSALVQIRHKATARAVSPPSNRR